MRISIYHNVLWSKYKGVVFSRVHDRAVDKGIDATFIQIAETEGIRTGLGAVDLSYHQYPFRLLFQGAYAGASLRERIIALSKDIFRNPTDLVVMPGYDRVEYWAMLLVCLMLGRKRAVFCDSTEYDRERIGWRALAKRVFFRQCNGFFCYGTRSKAYLRSYGVAESKINFRCQAAALPHDYDPQQVLHHYKELSPHAFDAMRFLYVGRYSFEKGLFDLLNAFAAVYTTRPDSKLDFVGAGPLEDALVKRVAELRLGDAVSFLGAKDMNEISRLLMRSSALVLPSHSEPWGLVVNEALSYGCPVVVSNVCGCVPDLVQEGESGNTFRVGDVASLTSAMIETAKMSANRLIAARNCLEAIAPFTPDRAASQILDGCVRIVWDAS